MTGCYISNDNWLHLSAILECKDPQQIPSVLDNAGVTEDIEADDNEQREPELGAEYPEELHYLLVQFDDFYFRPGEYVAYEREDSTDEEPKYFYAKILYRVQKPLSAKQRKDRKKKKQKAEDKLLSRYMVDIGSEKKEVDGLDLYKIKRPPKDEEGNKSDSARESMELVPYVGKTGDNRKVNAGPSTSSSRRATAEPPKPTTLQDAMEEVRKALKEIWKLPEDKRKKAVRRLYLRWHPDKNMEMQEIANEVIKFIQNEVDMLSRGGSTARDGNNFNRGRPDFSDFFREQQDFSDFFRHWNQRARRQRSSYDNFRRHNPRFTGFKSSSSRRRYPAPKAWFPYDRYDPCEHMETYTLRALRSLRVWIATIAEIEIFPSLRSLCCDRCDHMETRLNPRLAKIWMNQSRGDLRSVKYLLAAREPLYYLVCFQCHQVAEKALKASLYALSGLADSQLCTHDLLRLAHDLSLLPSGPNVTSLVPRLSNYYDETRSPGKQVPAKEPMDVFQDSQQAQEAFTTATDLLTRLEQFLRL